MLFHINIQLSKQQQQKVPDFCRYFVIFESFATPMYMFFYWFLAATTTPFLRSLRRLEFYYVTVQTLMLFIYIEYYHHHHRRWGFAPKTCGLDHSATSLTPPIEQQNCICVCIWICSTSRQKARWTYNSLRRRNQGDLPNPLGLQNVIVTGRFILPPKWDCSTKGRLLTDSTMVMCMCIIIVRVHLIALTGTKSPLDSVRLWIIKDFTVSTNGTKT